MRALALVIAVVAGHAVHAGTPVPGFTETVYVDSLSAPAAIAFLPDGRLLIAEQGGALKLKDGASVSTPITIGVCPGGELGLLGVAVDPSFASNGFIYLYRTENTGGCGAGRTNEVIRVTMGPGGTINAGSLTVLLPGIRTDNGNHNGGVLRIGPDAKLYVGVGDTGVGDNQGGPGSATNPYSQDLNALEGKILRLNLDGTIPSDNPFFGQAGKRGEIFAAGFRNPFRMGFDPLSGRLWVADVGDLTIEEIDIVGSGENFSWPYCEGTLPGGCAQPGDVAPIFTYPHGGGSSLGGCIIGGGFSGSGFGGLDDDYFFGDCNSSNIYHADVNGARDDVVGTPTLFVSGADVPADMVFGPDGALYYAAIAGGEVRRVAPQASGGEQLLGGKKLLLKDDADPAKKKLAVSSTKDLTIALGGAGDDPTAAGGSLRVRGATFDDTYPLPAGNWQPIGDPGDGKGFKYKDKLLSAGPVKVAQVKTGRLVKASGKGAGLGHGLGTDPRPVDVVLTLGGRSYCLQFGGTATLKPGKQLTAKDAPVPAGCP